MLSTPYHPIVMILFDRTFTLVALSLILSLGGMAVPYINVISTVVVFFMYTVKTSMAFQIFLQILYTVCVILCMRVTILQRVERVIAYHSVV